MTQLRAAYVRPTGQIASTELVRHPIARPEQLTAKGLCLITDVSAPVKPSSRVITTTANTCVTKIGHSVARRAQITPVPGAPIAKFNLKNRQLYLKNQQQQKKL